MGKSTPDNHPDPQNAEALISVDGELLPPAEARVSGFDSGFMLGDGVWDMRIERGVVTFFDQHVHVRPAQIAAGGAA